MPTLDKAILIAANAHQGQKTRYGETAILHPLRIMMSMITEDEKITAILHDVIEDSDWTLDDLRNEGFSAEIVEAVDCLTKREGEDYMDYIDRTKRTSLSQTVKIGDLEDNMNMQRVNREIIQKDLERFARYHKAWLSLNNV